MLRALPFVLIALMLAGCGSQAPTPEAKETKPKIDLAAPGDRPPPIGADAELSDDKVFKDADNGVMSGLGVVAYPGSRMAKETNGASVTDQGLAIILVTDDSPAKVAEFYLKNLPEAKQVGPKVEGMTVYALDAKNESNKPVRVQAQGGPKHTSIHIILKK